jgi:hypothetical protein
MAGVIFIVNNYASPVRGNNPFGHEYLHLTWHGGGGRLADKHFSPSFPSMAYEGATFTFTSLVKFTSITATDTLLVIT